MIACIVEAAGAHNAKKRALSTFWGRGPRSTNMGIRYLLVRVCPDVASFSVGRFCFVRHLGKQRLARFATHSGMSSCDKRWVVGNSKDYRTHDLRRGHALDLQLSSAGVRWFGPVSRSRLVLQGRTCGRYWKRVNEDRPLSWHIWISTGWRRTWLCKHMLTSLIVIKIDQQSALRACVILLANIAFVPRVLQCLQHVPPTIERFTMGFAQWCSTYLPKVAAPNPLSCETES